MAEKEDKVSFELNRDLVERFGPMKNDEIEAAKRDIITEEKARDIYKLASKSFLRAAYEKYDLKNKL